MIKAVLIPAVLAAGIACAPLTQANTQQDQMFIASKTTRSRREIPLHPAIVTMLRKHRTAQKEERLRAGQPVARHRLGVYHRAGAARRT